MPRGTPKSTAKKIVSNLSKAAGQPATPSAAATAPMAGAFYSPGDEPEAQSRAGFKTTFVQSVSGSMPIESGGSVDREVVEHMAAEANTEPNTLADEIARIRSTRKPIGAYTQKLALNEINGYKLHWFNDTAGRVEEAERNGWTHVKGSDGKPIARCVGTGRDKGALYAYAMKIPLVFWQEDMAARNADATAKVEALKASPFAAKAGQAQSSDKGKFYDPTEEGPLRVVKS